jgi:diguanylate cyclase (GGDEF)-like protein/PAS domain S-box-containing protein
VNVWTDVLPWAVPVAAAILVTVILPASLSLGHRRQRRHRPGFRSYQPELLDALYNDSPIFFAVVDRHGRFLDVNRDPSFLFGYTVRDMAGKPFLQIVDEPSKALTDEVFKRTLKGERCSHDIRVIHKAGHGIDLQIHTAPLVRRGRAVGIVVFVQDISERKRTMDRIHYMAYYDDMTGLPNRRWFTNHLQERLSDPAGKDRPLCVVYLDVDRLKLVNASFGRDFGDMLLMLVAERLTRQFRLPGQLARMEGDEFAAVFDDFIHPNEAVKRVEQLLGLFEEPFELNGIPIQLTVSVGAVMDGSSGGDAVTLLRMAETAMQRVKENGKNDYLFYSSDLERADLNNLKLHHELKRGLQNGEFVLHFQPQIDLKNGRIAGLEALVRWNHPERGLITPVEFVGAAEESGFIVGLGDWVLEEACRQNKAWQDAGLPPVPVSVNLSLRQFMQRNLVGKIADTLAKTGLDPAHLDLEITESMTMDVERAVQILRELKELGVTISIDDFGTGYSSFHHLKTFPIGRIKIDRQFLSDVGRNPGDAAIAAAIIMMGHSLNLKVTAEGVESEEQVRFLRQHRCDEIQGYYASPPLPASQIPDLLRRLA